jgi:1-phosphatidylinositol-4-phosphate 5-kinase
MKAVQKALHLPNQAVFGAAPSLAAMQSINKMTGSKKTLYRGATFWYYFRIYLPYAFPIVFLVFMILSLTVYQTVEGSLLLGSLMSLIMSCAVVISYIMIIPWRKHPSSLVLYRALTSIIFSFNIIFEAISTNEASCRSYAVVTHWAVLSGECWLTTIALDLVYSVTNPFISYQSNMKKYQMMVWTFTSFICFVFYFDTSCQGQFDQGICWVNITSTNSPCLWGYFMFWIVCMYAYQMYASLYAYIRLRKGLPLTFEVRKKCAIETFKCLLTYATYLSLLVLMFSIISSDPSPKPNSSMGNFSLFFLFILANRGSIDGIVWFMLHDFVREDNSNSTKENTSEVHGAQYVKLESGTQDDSLDIDENGDKSPKSHSHHHDSDLIHEVDEIKKSVTKTITELADLAIADLDEADLSPQVNMALRQQIVQYVTLGVKNSVSQIDIDQKPEPNLMDFFSFFGRGDPGMVPGLPVLDFLLDGEYRFKAFAPDVFRQLRQFEGIDDSTYLKVLSASANERLSEGASGAFMFFCGGGEYIVKTIRAREAKVLHYHLNKYASYIEKNPDSLLCRFLGSYSLEMFSQTFYFVVMLNCFDPNAYINERFDIKGSWVGRSAEPSKKTKKVVCRHCNEYFVPSKQEQCRAIVGPHEANVVLKDNDLRTKISLPPNEAARISHILLRDSDLLGKMGVLDYRYYCFLSFTVFPI